MKNFPLPYDMELYETRTHVAKIYGSAKYLPKHSKKIKNKKRKARKKKK